MQNKIKLNIIQIHTNKTLLLQNKTPEKINTVRFIYFLDEKKKGLMIVCSFWSIDFSVYLFK